MHFALFDMCMYFGIKITLGNYIAEERYYVSKSQVTSKFMEVYCFFENYEF